MAAMTPREAYLQRTYGIGEDEYAWMLDVQDGKCAICLRTPKGNLHVDHDHQTMKVRGLLCVTCNHDLLGRRDRDPALFMRAYRYLVDPPADEVLSPVHRVPKRKPKPRGKKGARKNVR